MARRPRSKGKSLVSLIDEWEPRVRKAFLQSFYDVRAKTSYTVIADLLAKGDVDGAVRAVGLDPGLFRPLTSTVEQVFEAAGKETSDWLPPNPSSNAAPIKTTFDVRDTSADSWLRAHSATLVREITDDQREAIRIHLSNGLDRGINPKTVALDLVGRVNKATGNREGGVIGLTASQTKWVTQYADDISGSDPSALKRTLVRKLRDKRFDRTIEKAIREGTGIPQDLQRKMVAAYKNRTMRYRAETIARTEATTSANQGQVEAMRQAIAAGQLDAGTILKKWNSAGDHRVRHTHRTLNGTEIQFGAMFVSSSGAQLEYPGDQRAPASEVVMCRCNLSTRIDFLADLD